MTDTVQTMIARLRVVHQGNVYKFEREHNRKVQIADQLKKHSEEIGEFIKAWDGKTTDSWVDEYWDCVFSMIAVLLNSGDLYVADAEILQGYEDCMRKIETRLKK